MLYPNIRGLREDNDRRQRQLAELLNVSQNTYSQYENGVIALTAEHLVIHASLERLFFPFSAFRTKQVKGSNKGGYQIV